MKRCEHCGALNPTPSTKARLPLRCEECGDFLDGDPEVLPELGEPLGYGTYLVLPHQIHDLW
jgi:hypothetical protein